MQNNTSKSSFHLWTGWTSHCILQLQQGVAQPVQTMPMMLVVAPARTQRRKNHGGGLVSPIICVF